MRKLLVLLMRSLWLAIITWMQLLGVIVNWHTNMCWRFILCIVSITTLPIRALNALRREKMMERLLQEMQFELENLSWDNEKLAAHMRLVIKEHHLMESMLADLEEEHDKAIDKIEVLEKEVELLKYENFRLKEVQIKGIWDPAKLEKISGPEKFDHHKSPWESSIRGNDNLLDLSLPKISQATEKQLQTEKNPSGFVNADMALDQRREVALLQSLFSAFLSLLVGMIIWEAKDPCMPLVMSLFMVVGLSLRSVVQFFSTIKNRPAADAVALLSVNWFILGTLSYPTLPKIARTFSPIIATFLERGLGLGSLW